MFRRVDPEWARDFHFGAAEQHFHFHFVFGDFAVSTFL